MSSDADPGARCGEPRGGGEFARFKDLIEARGAETDSARGVEPLKTSTA